MNKEKNKNDQKESTGAMNSIPAEVLQAVNELEHRIAVAIGERAPDLVLKGGWVADVYRERVWEADVAIAGRRIAAVRPGLDPMGAPVLDCSGLVAGPGFVEPHMHIETTFITPRQLARAIVPLGTTTLFADGTDSSYVAGARSVRALLDSTKNLPLRVFLEAPSYAAYLPEIQTLGGEVDFKAAQEMLGWPETVSLGEVVATKVTAREPEYLAKIAAYRLAGKRLNGHSALDVPRVLDAFVGAGIIDDHTSWSGESIEQRLARGMTLFLVEAPGRRHLLKMLEYVIAQELPTRSICLCIDNTTVLDIVRDGYGYLDYAARLAVEAGLPPVKALQLASLNPAAYFGREADIGSIAPGRFADIQLWSDLSSFRPRMVLFEGQVVAEDGKMTADLPRSDFPSWYLETVTLHSTLGMEAMLPIAPSDSTRALARVIELEGLNAQAANRENFHELPVRRGQVWPDPETGVVSFCVVERYGLNGNVGYGYLAGTGLKRGALATSVSISDSNIVVLGCDPLSMWTAVKAVAEMQGGFVVANGQEVCERLPAPVSGQMSDRPFEELIPAFERLEQAATKLGCVLSNPFLTMASTVLMSIPDLGLTDCGYIEARTGKAVPTFVGED